MTCRFARRGIFEIFAGAMNSANIDEVDELNLMLKKNPEMQEELFSSLVKVSDLNQGCLILLGLMI